MNCKEPVNSNEAEIFAGVFCCTRCALVARRFFERGAQDLNGLLLMLQESIRIALVRGELKLGTAEPFRDLSKKEVFEQIIKLREKMDANSDSTGLGHPPDQSGRPGRKGAAVR
jgi:hypothetical protein